MPTLRLYMRQQAAERQINESIAAAEANIAELEREIALWNDPAYIQAQARDRLGYVMPGQTAYQVIDPEVVVGEEAQAEFERSQGIREIPPGPWYLQTWDSIVVSGSTELTTPDPATQPTDPNTDPNADPNVAPNPDPNGQP